MKMVNGKQFFKKLEKRLGAIPIKNAERACFKSANLVKNTAVESIVRGAKTGATVKRYNPERTHTASAPGEPPASDTGFLANSIIAEVQSSRGITNEVIGMVRAQSPYAAHLEFGTQNMAARPFLQPALRKNHARIEAIFRKEGIIS